MAAVSGLAVHQTHSFICGQTATNDVAINIGHPHQPMQTGHTTQLNSLHMLLRKPVDGQKCRHADASTAYPT